MGLYYNPNPPHVGNHQPLEQRKLTPPQSGPPPQNPPFRGSFIGTETLVAWAAAVAITAISPILPAKLVPQAAIAAPLFKNINYEIVRAWDAPAPPIQSAINLDPPISGPAPQNPPFTGTRIPVEIQVGWIPPAPAPIVAKNLNPPIGIVAPSNPPFVGSYVRPEIQVAWIPPPPAPIRAINLDPPVSGPPPQNPPFAGTRVPVEVQIAWLPRPSAPIVAINGLPQSPSTPFFPYIGSVIPRAVIVSWLLPPPAPITAINLRPPIAGPAPQNPPLTGIRVRPEIQIAWIPLPPVPMRGGTVFGTTAPDAINGNIPPFTRRALYLRETTTRPASYWRGSRSTASIPGLAILDENGAPILDELGRYIESEG